MVGKRPLYVGDCLKITFNPNIHFLTEMQSHSHVNEQSNILDKLNLIVQALEEALKMFIKLTEKFEHFLAVIGALSMKVKTASGAFDEEPECAAPNVVKDGIESPTVGGLHEIAGLRGIKNLLHTLVILPRTQPQLFENRSKTNCILLYGPPGTGKTRLANALAAESGATFHSMSAGNFMSPNVGETERICEQMTASLYFSLMKLTGLAAGEPLENMTTQDGKPFSD
ncbi:hypothetical protein D910_09977 [Dendroctonus ponderosae]|uniref:ATPase AAA-type core domain-containing protein n=1 Tax=Dendroctonus ponderosae TaxID=77166 RepID=U4URH2_DENPD|nr:hypothetical protein D910_09977 [Dendroctonus ponderosae]